MLRGQARLILTLKQTKSVFNIILLDFMAHERSSPDFNKDHPHPTEIDAKPCSGSSVNPGDHAYHLVATEWIWHEGTRQILRPWRKGMSYWRKSNVTYLGGYIKPDEIPERYKFKERVLPVEIAQSHGLCSDCQQAPEFKEDFDKIAKRRQRISLGRILRGLVHR